MRSKRTRGVRSMLIVGNVLFMLAPWVASAQRTGGGKTRTDSSSSTPATVTSPSSSSAKSGSSSSSSSSSRSNDDDDAGAEIAQACCAGMIGALTEPSTADDVDTHEQPTSGSASSGNAGYTSSSTSATASSPASSSSSSSPSMVATPVPEPAKALDKKELIKGLKRAEVLIREECGTLEPGDVRMRVVAEPLGTFANPTFEPALPKAYAVCAQVQVEGVRIAAFDGDTIGVSRGLDLAPAEGEKPTASWGDLKPVDDSEEGAGGAQP